MKFKELKNYISLIDPLSICLKETGDYENYKHVGLIPDLYDDYYVYGIGMIETEFPVSDFPYEANSIEKICFKTALEIMLSTEPKLC